MSRLTEAVVATEGGSLIRLTVSTDSARNLVEGIDPWRSTVRVKVAARPVRGDANSELVSFLAEVLSVPSREIRIVKGPKASQKTVFVPLDAANVRERLGLT